MANDRSNFFFNVLALENILVALNREIGDGPCFLYIEFSWIGVLYLFILFSKWMMHVVVFLQFYNLNDLVNHSPLDSISSSLPIFNTIIVSYNLTRMFVVILQNYF